MYTSLQQNKYPVGVVKDNLFPYKIPEFKSGMIDVFVVIKADPGFKKERLRHKKGKKKFWKFWSFWKLRRNIILPQVFRAGSNALKLGNS